MADNLSNIKDIAKAFLNIEVSPTEFSPMVVQHPIFESGFQNILYQGEYKIVNILESEENLKLVINNLTQLINNCEKIIDIYYIIRKSYRLTFLKYIWKYLNIVDKSVLLSTAWVESENPNQDANVTIKTLISWFKQADKKMLMTEEDYDYYMSLPDKITVYRGVSKGRKLKGLSWTDDLSTAQWFAARFGKGKVYKAEISKDMVLAYFNTRNEKEIVVDVNKIANMKEI